ncbi:MAG: hypothetical protein HY564_02825 [Candidatus Jacksonbacteria bacterium]|nr:hypothetical protein [Candidatus Jacksonbacteria bacterium]
MTKIIGLKEFRSNITSLWKEAKNKHISYIVLHHSKPVLRVEPLFDEAEILEYLSLPRTNSKRDLVLPQETSELYSDEQIQQWLRTDKISHQTVQKIKRLLA